MKNVDYFLYNYGQAHNLQHSPVLLSALLVDLWRVDVAQIVPESGQCRDILSFDLFRLLLHSLINFIIK